MLGLYIHVPFCSAICNYCNFNRGLFDAELKTRYIDALITEIHKAGLKTCATSTTDRTCATSAADRTWATTAADQTWATTETNVAQDFSPADTIFFGGGTPSLLEPEDVARVIDACKSTFDVARDSEVTLEANPETVSEARLAGFRAAGVNRVSFGVQSFRETELRRLSRLHSADRARSAVAEARAGGFDNVSLDLMMWLPGQRVDDWLQSVDEAIRLAPDHLSLYLLEVYPNAPLKEEMARARWSQAPDEDAAAMYLTAMERLDAAGYAQYEISNVARPGRQSRHNLKYWTDGEWLGFGCGAHSTVDGVRWKNVSGTEEYVQKIQQNQPVAMDWRRLTPDERLGDAIFTGLRLTEGVSLDMFRDRYGVDVWARWGRELEPFIIEKMLVQEGGRLRLTRAGMLLAHEVMAIFV